MVLNTGSQYKRPHRCQFFLSFQFNLMIFVSIVLDEAILFLFVRNRVRQDSCFCIKHHQKQRENHFMHHINWKNTHFLFFFFSGVSSFIFAAIIRISQQKSLSYTQKKQLKLKRKMNDTQNQNSMNGAANKWTEKKTATTKLRALRALRKMSMITNFVA